MNKLKKDLYERNYNALEVNKGIEEYVNGVMDNIRSKSYCSEIEVMTQMLFEKNQDIMFDIYTVECLIQRANKPQVLEWCGCMIDCIEKKTMVLNSSCDVIRSMVEVSAPDGGEVFERA